MGQHYFNKATLLSLFLSLKEFVLVLLRNAVCNQVQLEGSFESNMPSSHFEDTIYNLSVVNRFTAVAYM